MPSTRCARRCAAAAHSPNAPSTCSQAPAARVRSRDLRERIERARVDVAGLHAHDRRGRERRQRVGAHPALLVDGHPHEPVAPEADEPERLDQRRMRLLADHDRDRRRAEEAVGLDVPVEAGEHGVAGCRERAEVGHRGPGDERARAALGQAEELAHPLQRDRLQQRGRRRRSVEGGVLIPGRGEPVRGQRRRQRPADHEAEEARSRRAHRGRRAELVEQGEHVARLARAVGERLAQRLEPHVRLRRRRDGALLDLRQIAGRAVSGACEQVLHVNSPGGERRLSFVANVTKEGCDALDRRA